MLNLTLFTQLAFAGPPQTGDTLRFSTVDPVRESIRRLEGLFGVPISSDLGPSRHFQTAQKPGTPSSFAFVVPGQTKIYEALLDIVDRAPLHDAWDGCRKLVVDKLPLTVRAIQVIDNGQCASYRSKLDIKLATAGVSSFRELAGEAGVSFTPPFDPIPPGAFQDQSSTTLRKVMDQTLPKLPHGYSYRLQQSPFVDFWGLIVVRVGAFGMDDLDPKDYPFHSANYTSQQRAALDEKYGDRTSHLQEVKTQSNTEWADAMRRINAHRKEGVPVESENPSTIPPDKNSLE